MGSQMLQLFKTQEEVALPTATALYRARRLLVIFGRGPRLRDLVKGDVYAARALLAAFRQVLPEFPSIRLRVLRALEQPLFEPVEADSKRGARCQQCDCNMLAVDGCTNHSHVVYRDGSVLPAIPWEGGEVNGLDRCGDCHVLPGEFHHVGCDMEQSPRGDYQLITDPEWAG